MKELTQQACFHVQGGLTGLETVLGCSLAGGTIGSIGGAIVLAGNAVGDYAFVGNAIGAAFGWIYGGILGVVVGAAVGLVSVSVSPRGGSESRRGL